MEFGVNTIKMKFLVFLNLLHVTGLVTHKRESLDVDVRSITKNSFCLLALLLYVPDNSYGHVGTLAVEKDVKR